MNFSDFGAQAAEYERTRVVRLYTTEEVAATALPTHGMPETPEEKFERRMRAHTINVSRYMQAAENFPHKAGHFARLISVANRAIVAWSQDVPCKLSVKEDMQ